MNKLYRIKPLFILFLMTVLLLAACSSAAQSPAAEAPATQADAPATETQATEVQHTEAQPAETARRREMAAIEEEAREVPAELEAIFGVTADDWVVGSDSAAVTFVEYSDFQ